jgi:hypothetical protein
MGIFMVTYNRGNVCKNNVFFDNGLAIMIGDGAGSTIIQSNTIYSNDTGISVGNGGNEIIGNTIVTNHMGAQFGIGVFGNIIFSENTVSENDYGLGLYNPIIYLQVYRNNFQDNLSHVVGMYYPNYDYNSRFSLPMPIGGNYWKDWVLPDSDNDGIVDEPYIPFCVTDPDNPSIGYCTSDDYPWTEPNSWLSDSARIDVKPGSSENSYSSQRTGPISVVIFGSETLNVTQIDVSSLRLKAPVINVGRRVIKRSVQYQYFDSDSHMDLVVAFHDSDSRVSIGSDRAQLSGKLIHGVSIAGSDSICIVP